MDYTPNPIPAIIILLLTYGHGFTPAAAFVNKLQRCPALENQNGLECSTSFGLTNCSLPQEVGNEVKCKEFYLPRNGDSESVCGMDSEWTVPDFKCQIDCGRLSGSSSKHRPFHAVILQAVKVNQTVKICSGSLIDETLILTTRHCLVGVKGNVLEPYELYVQLGNDNEKNKLNRPVKELYFLPQLSLNTSNATDLALLRLEHEVEFNANVLPICLPTCEQTDSIALRDGSYGEVMSEGKDAEKFKIKHSEECSLHNMVCAGQDNGKTSLCQEETGLGITVPLVDNIHFLHGVLSNEYWTSCKKFRPFKRVFPYVRWIQSVMDYSAEPYFSPLDDEDFEPTPKFECFDSDEVKNKEWFREIPEGRQRKSTELQVNDKKIRTCDLLNSLRGSQNMKVLNLTLVTLTTGFHEKVTLPKLTHYHLYTLERINAVNFTDYFPFYKKDGSSWKTRDLANLGIDIVIENGVQVEVHPEKGQIVIKNIDNADEILSGVIPTFKLRSLSLEFVNVSVKSFPNSLKTLALYEPTIKDGSLADVLKKTDQLEYLTLSFSATRSIPIATLPLKTLKTLMIGKVNLTSNEPWGLVSYDVFQNLDTLFISTEHSAFDKNTRKGFLEIFKTCKRVGYFGKDDFDLVRTILKLENLVEVTLRIQGNKEDAEVKDFFDEVKFDLESVKTLEVVKFVKLQDGSGFNITVREPSWDTDDITDEFQ